LKLAKKRYKVRHQPYDVIGCWVRGSMVAGRRLAMNRVFLTTHREWVEFIIATVLLWLLMMVAIHELELRTVS
jgi:hypothetical protein